MKKKTIIALLLVIGLALTAFSACGSKNDLSDSKYVGTWKCVKITMKDESGQLEHDWVLEIKGDGTGIQKATGEEDSQFTWEPVDGGFKTKGDLKLTFKDDGDNIKTKLLGAEMIFEKQ